MLTNIKVSFCSPNVFTYHSNVLYFILYLIYWSWKNIGSLVVNLIFEFLMFSNPKIDVLFVSLEVESAILYICYLSSTKAPVYWFWGNLYSPRVIIFVYFVWIMLCLILYHLCKIVTYLNLVPVISRSDYLWFWYLVILKKRRKKKCNKKVILYL